MSQNKNRYYRITTNRVIRANNQRDAIAFAEGDDKVLANEISSRTKVYRVYASELVDA